MNEKDVKAKEYLSDNKRFADLFNYYLFDGKLMIEPEQLQERDTQELLTLYGADGKETTKEKWRDLLKRAIIKTTGNTLLVLLGIENQSEIHYAMPVRTMNYDAMNYAAQVTEAARRHREQKNYESRAEFLSGFGKSDRLIPVITLTVYWGADKWDAPRCLHDMFAGENRELLRFIDNYRLHLIIPDEITNFEKFRTSIGEVLEVIKASESEQEMEQILNSNPAFRKLENEAVSVINAFTKIKVRVNEKEATTDMCKAWEEHLETGKEIGKEIGKELGVELSAKVYRQIMAGERDNSVIAENCSCTLQEVVEIRKAFEI